MSLSLIEQYYVNEVNVEDDDVREEETSHNGIGEENVFENIQTDNTNEEGELGVCADIKVKVELLELDGEIIFSEGADGLATVATDGGGRSSQKIKTERRSMEDDGDDEDKTEISQKVDVDLNQTWPFTNCRIVLQLEDDLGGGEEFGGSLKEGWAKEGTKHVFYDKVTTKEAKDMGEQLRQKKHSTLSMKKRNGLSWRPCHNRITQIRPTGQGQKTALKSDLHLLNPQNGTDMVVEAVFKCPYCLEIFPEGDGLILHFATQHNLHERIKIKPENTGKISTIFDNHNKESIFIQVPSENGNKQFQCIQCGKAFPRAYKVTRHYNLVHIGKRPFKCETCSAAFSTVSSLQRHVQSSHLGIKRHTCTQCGKGFYDRGALNRHFFTHTGSRPRPFKCSLCLKCFTDRKSLSLHNMIHTGEKPHQCPKCPWKFSSTSMLKRHILSHTGRRNYKCLDCGMRFKYSQSLRRHQVAQKHLAEEEEF